MPKPLKTGLALLLSLAALGARAQDDGAKAYLVSNAHLDEGD